MFVITNCYFVDEKNIFLEFNNLFDKKECILNIDSYVFRYIWIACSMDTCEALYFTIKRNADEEKFYKNKLLKDLKLSSLEDSIVLHVVEDNNVKP